MAETGVLGVVLVMDKEEGVAVDASLVMEMGGAGTGVKRGCCPDDKSRSQ